MMRFKSFFVINTILELLLVTSFSRWQIPSKSPFISSKCLFSTDENDDLTVDDDAMDFESLIKKGFVNPIKMGSSDGEERAQFLKEVLKNKNVDAGETGTTGENAESIFRKYPFENLGLPVLNDCNNFYSGKFKDFFWHQNGDQVLVYIPIESDVAKSDIKVDFAVKKVRVSMKGEEILHFQCLERIIPDGSFWVIEEDKDNVKYIQLDLEKRFRMINWNHLLCENTRASDSERDMDKMRSETLEKLFAANKGLSRLTGKPPETLEDMTDEEIASITAEINEEPDIISETESDEVPQEFIDAEFEDANSNK